MSDRNLDALPPGVVIDGYRIERNLGAGGFGITYLAKEVESGRKVAIKEFMYGARRGPDGLAVRFASAQERADFEWGLDRFRDEARTLIRIRHPNIVETLRLFSANETAYIVMDYVEAETLEALLKRRGTLPENDLRAIAGPLLDGLAAIHRERFLHRDLKPGNILIRRADGQPIIIDFGAAREALGRETLSLTAIISPGYSPPEQYGEESRQRESSDLYAVGATFYHCVCGERPPAAPDRQSALNRGEHDPLTPASQIAGGLYTPALLATIDAALALREDERPQTAADFRAGMLADSSPTDAIPTTTYGEKSAQTTGRPDRTTRGPLATLIPDPIVTHTAPRPEPNSAAHMISQSSRRRRRALVAAGLLFAGTAAILALQPMAPRQSADTPPSSAPERRGVETDRERAAIEEEKQRRAEAERKRAEEEERAKREEERRKVEAERARIEEEKQRRADAERKRVEEEERAKRDEEHRKVEAERAAIEEEKRRRAEAERKRAEEEARPKREEERRKVEPERAATEEEKRRRADAERKRAEDDSYRKREEERRKVEAERAAIEEEQKRRAEEETKRGRRGEAERRTAPRAMINPVQREVGRLHIAVALRATGRGAYSADAVSALREQLSRVRPGLRVLSGFFRHDLFKDAHFEEILGGNPELLRAADAFVDVDRILLMEVSSECSPAQSTEAVYSCRLMARFRSYRSPAGSFDEGTITSVGAGHTEVNAVIRAAEIMFESYGTRLLQ